MSNDTTTIPWEEWFDKVFCIYFLPNNTRMTRLEAELRRIGLLESSVFEWRFTTPSPYDKIVQDHYKDKKWIESIGCVNVALETNRILKESLLLGYKRILILEDDVAFLKDMSQLEKIIAHIPEGYDVIQLDKGCWGAAKAREWNEVKRYAINEYFVDAGKHHFGLSSANVFSPSGMKLAIGLLDEKPIACDQLDFDGRFKWAIAKENACIQVMFNDSNYNNRTSCHYIYQSIGIDYRKYAIPEGYNSTTLFAPSRDDKKPKKTLKSKMIHMKNRWDRFDYIGLVCYTGYKDRVELLKPELKRVGLDEKVNFHWDCPSEFRKKLFAAVKKSPFCGTGGCFNMTVQHYTILKTAYELGCQNVLVMEDDIRFLKSLSKIDEILEAIPMDFDQLMFDRNKLTGTEISEFTAITEEQKKRIWNPFFDAGSTGCYAMSRRGMKHYIDLLDEDIKHGTVKNPDFYFRAKRDARIFWDSSYKRYFCYPNLAVQSVCGQNGSFSNLDYYWNNLDMAGIRQEDYKLDFPVISDDSYIDTVYKIVDEQDKEPRKGKCICDNNKAIETIVGKWKEVDANKKVDRVYVWGNAPSSYRKKLLQRCIKDNAQLCLCEEGFIRSYNIWEANTSEMYKQLHSIIIDTRAYHFDATRISTIEKMLNDFHLIVSPEQRLEARRLINKIVTNKISKYNHQPLSMPKVGRDGRKKVLVVDQTFGDFSVTLGMASEKTFTKMLNCAISENPDADILVKTHPCALQGGFYGKGYYQDLKTHDNIFKITSPINPYSLLEICDKVYVCSSQLGLEALMANKEVHVFGMPFYAGWGLTIDDQHLDRRTNMRTLEELFYIYCCMYTHWVDPDKGCETTMDAVIDKMIAMRGRANTYARPPNLPRGAAPRPIVYRQRGPIPPTQYSPERIKALRAAAARNRTAAGGVNTNFFD